MFDKALGTSDGAINVDLDKPCQGIEDMEGSAKKLVEYWKDHLSSSTPAITYQGIHWWMSIISGGANIMLKQAVVAIVFVLWLQRNLLQGDIILQSIFLQMVPQRIFSGFSVSTAR